MGNNHSRWFGKNKRKVIFLGLENSGKSTFLSYLLTNKFDESLQPTKDVAIETVKIKKLKLIIFDLAGAERQRIFWRHNFQGTQGVIFFIDGQDEDKFQQVSIELKNIVFEKELNDAAILIFINKSDQLQMSSTDDLYQYFNKKFEFDKMISSKTNVKIEIGSIKTQQSIDDGINWLCQSMKAL